MCLVCNRVKSGYRFAVHGWLTPAVWGTDTKVVYRRYASLFFVCGITQGDNELATLEIIHRYVEVLDRYFALSGPALIYQYHIVRALQVLIMKHLLMEGYRARCSRPV